ncbi:PREDICTED: alpha-tocopherol transfer protein-like isoform X2 [Ceratosolen solmsi marchali]|uniref:Alpha-tocopherol transfer protein-like isoform X2 n=1 Tax=Ceratosolen solmsi marchali TaxID=326594 RepID=A0AAJ6YVN7_9HYME|nr:PREDICTED: alpha-tocopherol transfer protein-like isoform X2 [Ceratosolen solmsi marchali]
MSEQVIEELLNKLKSASLAIGGTEITLDCNDLDDYHIEKAQRELRETPELVQESFKILGDLLGDEENLFIPLDQKFLQRFLRRCKWYPRSTFKLIQRFYEYQKNHPEFFDNLLPSNERAIFTSEILTPLPLRTSDGLRIFVIQAGRKWNPKEVSLNQIFRGVILNLIVAISEPKTQVSGVRVILDMEGLTLTHVTYFTPSFASAIIEFVQKCLPCRLKGVHIINQSFIFDMGKLRDRIYFHGDNKASLLSYIDSKVLPKKFGGDFDLPEESFGELFYQHAAHFEDYFIDYNRYGYVSEI